MATYLFQFRELFNELHEAKSWQVAPLLYDWSSRNAAILEPLRQFQRFNALGHFYPVERGELESFYALSRVCDILLLPFQSGECWFNLHREQFVDFWQTLGIAAREPRDYHPFWCEIVACENIEDDNAPPRIEEILWPALTWGDLLICRAGARVCAGRNWLNGDVAASSPLYFAYQRNSRKARDLSHGWGSNSQWGTDFRRDYVWNEHYVFNADGALNHQSAPFLQNLSAHQWTELLMQPRQFFASDKGDNGDLTLAQREELLVNRCFVRDAHNDTGDFWPYDDVAVWQASVPSE